MMAHSAILLAADHTKYHASAAVEIGNVARPRRCLPMNVRQALKSS
jgi:hypothetical protein